MILIFLLILSFSALADLPCLDISYNEACLLAVENSKQLNAERFNLLSNSKRNKADIGRYLPRLSIAYNEGSNVVYEGPDRENHDLSICLEQLIFEGGKEKINRQLSAFELIQASMQLDAEAAAIIGKVGEIYTEVLALLEEKEIRADNLYLAREQLRILGVKRAVGEARESDVLEAELEMKSIEMEFLDIGFRIDDSMSELKNFIGVPDGAELSLVERINKDYAGLNLGPKVEDMFSFAMDNNLQLKILENKIMQKRKQNELLEKSSWPELYGRFSCGFSGNKFPLGNPSFSIEFVLAFPENAALKNFNFSASGDLNKSRALNSNTVLVSPTDFASSIDKMDMTLAVKTAVLDKDSFCKELLAELKRLIRNYEFFQSRLEVQKQVEELIKNSISVMEKQLELGEITPMELLKNGNRLAAEKISRLEQILSLLQIEAELEDLIGLTPGGLGLFDPNAAGIYD